MVFVNIVKKKFGLRTTFSSKKKNNKEMKNYIEKTFGVCNLSIKFQGRPLELCAKPMHVAPWNFKIICLIISMIELTQ